MAKFADLKQSMKDLVMTNHDIDLLANPLRMYCVSMCVFVAAGVALLVV